MTITICDICGKQTEQSTGPLTVYKFAISSHGKVLDICNDCRESLNKWITIRKTEREDDVLDKIRAEIVQMNEDTSKILMPFDSIEKVKYTTGFIKGLESTLDIIDKYNAESEE